VHQALRPRGRSLLGGLVQDVTIVSCLYGDTHDAFVARWAAGIAGLTVAPAAVIVATDNERDRVVPGADVYRSALRWQHPQAHYLNDAVALSGTEWIWFLDIDDIAFPDALEGLEGVTADVWQLGYLRSDGEEYIPPQLTAVEVLDSNRNPFVAGSCVRRKAFWRVGGFRDIALQDWGLWRALAAEGATFQSSGRTHFHYMRHPNTRGAVELGLDSRPHHMREMEAALA